MRLFRKVRARLWLWLVTLCVLLMRAVVPPPQRAYATTGPAHGEEVEFQVDDAVGGTLRDISPYVRDVSWSIDGQVVDVTGFKATNDWRTFIAGLRGAVVTISGVIDDTATVGTVPMLKDMVNQLRSIQYGPLGITSGEPKISAEAIGTSFEIGSTIEGESTFSASWQVTAAVAFGTY